METPPAKPSALKRFCRKALFALAVLVTLAAGFLAEEHWRGARTWQNYKREMEAKGEHFDAARLIPPQVPDAQNFAMTPYFAWVFNLPPEVLRQPLQRATKTANDIVGVDDLVAKHATNLGSLLPDSVILPRRFTCTWRYGLADDLLLWAAGFQDTNSAALPAEITDPAQAASFILDNLKTCETTLAELQSAGARPSCRFNIPYEVYDTPQALSALLEHFVLIKGLDRFLTLHAEAEMVLGRTDQALKDLQVMFRMDDGLKDEPLLISQLVRLAGAAIILESVGQGLAEHRWSEAQLQVLQDRLQKTDLIASTVQALYGERDLCSNRKFDQGYISPPGWNRLEQLNLNRAFNQTVLPRIDLAGREISPSFNHSMDLVFHQSYEGKGFSAFLHHNIMASMMLPGFSGVGEKVALAQSGVDLAMLACALERYRLAQGQYPEELAALVPRFVAVLPHDIINGQPLKYRRTEDGRFVLYSVGWNEKDDGGVVATKDKPPRLDALQGDWVWQYRGN